MKRFIAIALVITVASAVCSVGFPIQAASAEPVSELSVDAKAAYLTDFDTGVTMYEMNADERYPIASMVKIMVCLLTFEAIDAGKAAYTDEIEISETAASMGGSQVFLEAGDVHTLDNLLKCVAVASANDAAVAIAEHIGGSESGFVALMNKRVKDLGLKNTVFVNATGLPQSGQYSSARDVSGMLRELLKHERYYGYCKIWLEDYAHPDGRTTTITNTNKLTRFYKGCDSGKTGFTSEAMYCLSASAERGGMRIISTVIGAPTSKSRNADVAEMFDYAFGAYENAVLFDVDTPIENTVEVKRGKSTSLTLVAAERICTLSKRGEEAAVTVEYDLPDTVKAPIVKGDRIGSLTVYRNGEAVKTVDVVAAEDVKKANLLDHIKQITDNM